MASEKRLIYAECAKSIMCELMDRELYIAEGCVDSCPTVDAEEVVRCKDCKHWKPSGSMAGNSEDDLQPIGGCKWANCCRRADDFCSYGERKDNERKAD